MYYTGVFKKLDSVQGDTTNVRASCALEYTAFVTGKVGDIGEAADHFDVLMKDFHARCEALGISLIRASGHVRPMSQVELISIVPRKWHFMGPEGTQVCAVPYVSEKFLTDDPTKVDCKLCRKKMDGNR